MKVYILTCVLVVTISASTLEGLEVEFKAFKVKHGKTYRNQVEERKRFNIFKDNLRAIEEHNAFYEQGLVSYRQGITKFADITQEEFRTWLTLSASNKLNFKATEYVKSGLATPDSIDWRTKGQVTEIKDQGSCGSCWAFSIVGSIEGAHYRHSGKLVSLSEQQLIDCSTDINNGCNGGYLDESFPYIQQYGIESEKTYPYHGKGSNTCKYSASKVVTKISGYKTIAFKDEDALREVVGNIGPVSVGMDATFLSLYHSGIYTDTKCFPVYLNHAILIVGYGTENNVDFWIVKNSWGEGWGDKGFFRIRRGTDECGIAEDSVYPTID